jgi:hypothetical protein
MRYSIPIAASLLALAGCVAPPIAPVAPPAPVVTPASRPTPAPPPLAIDWNDWPFTPGDWAYARYNGRSSATFGFPDTGRLTLSCTAERTIRITLSGQSAGAITIRTTSLTRSLSTTPLGAPATGIWATLSANDPLLDAIAFSRGRFVVEQAAQPPLVVPPYAEIGRVIEDCRG